MHATENARAMLKNRDRERRKPQRKKKKQINFSHLLKERRTKLPWRREMRLKKMQGYGRVTKQPSHTSCTRDINVELVDTVTNSRWAWNAAI